MPAIAFTLGGAAGEAGQFARDFGLAIQSRADAAEGAIAESNTAGLRRVIGGYKAQLQDDVARSGMVNAARLAKIWRGVVYPQSGASLSPAGYVKAGSGPVGSASRQSAALLVDAFELGVTIRARGSRFLAIPVGPAKAIVRRLNLARNRTRDSSGRFSDEAGMVQRVAQALGLPKLEARIDVGLKAGILFAPGINLNDRNRRLRRPADTILFILVPQATLRKRFRGRALLAELQQAFPADFGAAAFDELAQRTTS